MASVRAGMSGDDGQSLTAGSSGAGGTNTGQSLTAHAMLANMDGSAGVQAPSSVSREFAGGEPRDDQGRVAMLEQQVTTLEGQVDVLQRCITRQDAEVVNLQEQVLYLTRMLEEVWRQHMEARRDGRNLQEGGARMVMESKGQKGWKGQPKGSTFSWQRAIEAKGSAKGQTQTQTTLPLQSGRVFAKARPLRGEDMYDGKGRDGKGNTKGGP